MRGSWWVGPHFFIPSSPACITPTTSFSVRWFSFQALPCSVRYKIQTRLHPFRRRPALSGLTASVSSWVGMAAALPASISLGRRVAPCRDSVYSFATLWAALSGSHNWHRHQRREARGQWKDEAGTVSTDQLTPTPLTPPPPSPPPLPSCAVWLVKRGALLSWG